MLSVGFLWLALSIGSEITGTSLIKKTDSFRKPMMSVIVIFAYCLCYYALTKSMNTVPVGVAYSLWCGFGIIGVTILSILIYKQRPDFPALLSMGLIIIGSIIINMFSSM